VVSRLTKASENEIADAVALFLGLAIGGTREGHTFLRNRTLTIFGLGFPAVRLDGATRATFGGPLCFAWGGKINPPIAEAGISAYLIAASVALTEGNHYDKKNSLLMDAMGAKTGGGVGPVTAAAIMLSILK